MERIQIFEIENQIEYLNEETIKKAVKRHKIIEWAYCVHDKDIYTAEDEKRNPEHKAGTQKPEHIHFMGRLSEGRYIHQIAEWFGVKDQYVQKCKSKSMKAYKFNDMLAYLIHANKPEKYQYDLSEVKTNIEDLAERIEDYKERMAGKPLKTRNISEDRRQLEEIVEKIAQGEIKEYNYTDYISSVLYSKFTREIKAAFEYRRAIVAKQGRQMDVYYFCGEAGAGKTTYAQQIAKDKGLSCFVSSSDNDILDGYRGEEVIVLDDLRPDSVKLANLLKLLDNNTNSTVQSRYHNKIIEAKIIIITSIYNLEDFFNMTIKDIGGCEPIRQLRRRIVMYADFNDNRIKEYMYNKQDDSYEYIATFENPIKEKYPKTAPVDNLRASLKSLFTNEIIENNNEDITEKSDEEKLNEIFGFSLFGNNQSDKSVLS